MQTTIQGLKMAIQFSRFWAMPSADTFDCEPIKGFVQKYLMKSKVSVDPFARNKRWATHTNDLNPETAADYHMEAEEFLAMIKTDGIKPDLVIFDPPYSLSQAKQCYESFGIKFGTYQAQDIGRWVKCKSIIGELAPEVVLSFGFDSRGVGKQHGFEAIEILLVCHGGEHNDTICMAERKVNGHPELFSSLTSESINKQNRVYGL